MADLPFQPALFGDAAPSFDASFAGMERIRLDEASWLDFAAGWVRGTDRLFAEVLGARRFDGLLNQLPEGTLSDLDCGLDLLPARPRVAGAGAM